MAGQKPNGERRQGRAWTFAGCRLDENLWVLTVGGARVPLEAKPLELLHELLLNAGKVVTKEELLDRIWPGVIVVEASLPTAVRKVRIALGDDRRESPIIETVAGIGYRLAVPVECDRRSALPSVYPAAGASRHSDATRTATAGARRWLVPAMMSAAIVAVAILVVVSPLENGAASTEARRVTQREAGNALRRLDIARIEAMIADGWDPNTPFDDQGNNAINYLLNMCEWDRNHDQRRMLLMVRTLFDAGAHVDRPNVWGDTAYSIAKAPRYCGPAHPVTVMLHNHCYSGPLSVGDRCLATYELARGQLGARSRQYSGQSPTKGP